jgi:hypothetical protein
MDEKVIIVQAENANRMQIRLNKLVNQGFLILGAPFIDPTSMPAMWHCTLIRKSRMKETRQEIRTHEHSEIRTI